MGLAAEPLERWWLQTKGTPSLGKKHNKTHTLCRRCGRRSFHIQKHTCAACGYPSAKTRKCTSVCLLRRLLPRIRYTHRVTKRRSLAVVTTCSTMLRGPLCPAVILSAHIPLTPLPWQVPVGRFALRHAKR